MIKRVELMLTKDSNFSFNENELYVTSFQFSINVRTYVQFKLG